MLKVKTCLAVASVAVMSCFALLARRPTAAAGMAVQVVMPAVFPVRT